MPKTWPRPEIEAPDMEQYLADTLSDSEFSESTDGCSPVDPDGTCEHGYPSWERYWGII